MTIPGIGFSQTLAGITGEELEGFFAGWKRRPSPSLRLSVLQASHRVVIARDSKTQAIAGFATAVTDDVIAAYITLLEVLPGYRQRGIGSELLRRIVDALGPLYMIDALCDEQVVSFYQRAGFNAAVGMTRRNPAALGDG